MNDGISFLGIAALSLVGLLWLGGYVYGLYWLATKMGRRFRSKHGPWPAVSIAIVAAGLLSTTAWLLPADRFTRFCLGLVVFVAHAHPLCVGFWVASQAIRREDHRRWKEQTDAWLSEWEPTHKD